MDQQNPGCASACSLAVAVLAAIFAFHGALMELSHRWATQEEYSHGFLIPVVSAWLLWRRRNALRAAVGRPSWTGPVLVLLAFAMHVIGELSSVFILSHIAFVIVLAGIVLCIGGYRLLAATFVPIAFLLFAIPLPYFIDAELTLRLQLLSSQLGAFLIRMFGVPVYLDGNIIDLGNYQLQVVEACSGLRYLYPLLSVSFLAAYIFDGAALATRPAVLFRHSHRHSHERIQNWLGRHPGRSLGNCNGRRGLTFLRGLDHFPRLWGALAIGNVSDVDVVAAAAVGHCAVPGDKRKPTIRH